MKTIQQQELGFLMPALIVGVVLVFATPPGWAQAFDSGSDGSDGALVFPVGSGAHIFDPTSFEPPLDADGDGVYHFTTIDIGSGVTVRLRSQELGSRGVIWLATGNVQIDGTLDLDGEDGSTAGTVPRAGAGGFDGGAGMTLTRGAQPGGGPGGGLVHIGGPPYAPGGGAGHSLPGGAATCVVDCATESAAYGNPFLQPLLGGSGGAGGGLSTADGALDGDSGGAGGGAILIASTVRIGLQGSIRAGGGDGAVGSTLPGGGGSGGGIRLIAPSVEGNGSLYTGGGSGGVWNSNSTGGVGSAGRARIEAYDDRFTGGTYPQEIRRSVPGSVLPVANTPIVRIATLAGVAAPANPGGGYQPVDMTVNAAGETSIDLEGAYVPLGTQVELTLSGEDGETVQVVSTPLAGTFEASTASATITLPSGFSKFTIRATWTP